MKKKLIGFALAAAALSVAATFVGYSDWQLRESAPGNPGSGYLRTWADTTAGAFKCLTSAGASCYFPASLTTTVTGVLPVAHGGSGLAVAHGSAGTYLQLSDGTGVSGHCTQFASDGSVTDAGAVCGTGGTGGTTIWTGLGGPNGTPFSPLMTSATTPSPYAVSDSQHANTSLAGWHVFDGIAADGWITTGGPPAQLYLDLGPSSTAVLATYTIQCCTLGTMYATSAWTVAGSNDNVTYTTVSTQSGISWSSTSQVQSFSASGSTAYRYFRFNVTAPASQLGFAQIVMSPPAFASGAAGDFYYATSTNTWYGPRPAGTTPVWPLALGPTSTGTGAKFSASGCSNTTTLGGATAGSYHSGTTGTCTVVISTGITAPNGWACGANDLTTPADVQPQTATTTTTATIAGTTVSGDVVDFHCVPF
jgi:hypothetical protein